MTTLAKSNEEVLALAKVCGLTTDDLKKFNHRRLSIDEDDAKFWVDQKLPKYEIAARFTARRIMIELAYASDTEIPDQGTLSGFVASSKLEASLIEFAKQKYKQ